MPITMSILIVVPAFRCEKQIGRVLNELDTLLVSYVGQIIKIVVIDNQSSDQTLNSAIRAIEGLRHPDCFAVVLNDENYGLGGSHKVGFKIARQLGASHLAVVHGDNQANALELGKFIESADQYPALDAILGSRFMSDSRLNGYSKVREFGNRALNLVYAALSWRDVKDLGSGLNLFRCGAYHEKDLSKFSDGFTFNMDSLLYLFSKNALVKFVPITWSETDQISNAKTFSVGWITLKTVLRWRFLGLRASESSSRSYSFQVQFGELK